MTATAPTPAVTNTGDHLWVRTIEGGTCRATAITGLPISSMTNRGGSSRSRTRDFYVFVESTTSDVAAICSSEDAARQTQFALMTALVRHRDDAGVLTHNGKTNWTFTPIEVPAHA